VDGMAERAGGPFPPLRPRTLRDEVSRLVRQGPVWHRSET
jgi:hypothetical protein